MYEKGLGVPVDPEQAAGWYRKAAAQGHEGAERNLNELIASLPAVEIEAVKETAPAVDWDYYCIQTEAIDLAIGRCTYLIESGTLSGSGLADTYQIRGSHYARKGDYDRAIADYDKAIEFNTDDALSYSSRGFVYRLKRDYERAIADYDRAIGIDPDFSTAYYGRSKVYREKGDLDRAAADCDKARQIVPNIYC